MTPREIIAKGLFRNVKHFGQSECEAYARHAIEALTTAGFRILGPDEIDGPTVEKCAEVIKMLFRDVDTDKALAQFSRRVALKEKRT